MQKITKKNKKLIGVSGGVDSMVLLHKFHKDNIVVCHVNYNLRDDSKLEEKIVKEFCNKNKIKYYIFSVQEKHEGNFQKWAREKRYYFFQKIYKKENCDYLLLAHHKDDFLETALMNKERGREPYFLGIEEFKYNYGMNIYRPFVNKYFKEELYSIAKEKKISFNDDKSNFETKYSRNKIRKKLNDKTNQEKNNLISKINKENEVLRIKKEEIYNEYKLWKNKNFSIVFFRNKIEFQYSLIFEFIINNYEGIKISKNKLKMISEFVLSKNESKKIRISKNKYLYKDKERIYNFLNE